MRQAIDRSTGRAWSIVSGVRHDNRGYLGFYSCPNLHDGVSEYFEDKKWTNETPRGARLRFSRDRSWSAGETRWLSERRNDSGAAVGQTGSNKPIPIIPIAARNPAGKAAGTNRCRGMHRIPKATSEVVNNAQEPLYTVEHQTGIWKRSTSCEK